MNTRCTILTSVAALAISGAVLANPHTSNKPSEFQTVTGRFPELTNADSIDSAKVAIAIGKATSDMWYAAGACDARHSGFQFAPYDRPSGYVVDPDAVGVEDDSGTPEHPYAMVWTAQGTVRMAVRTTVVPPGTPFLVWSRDGGRLTVVTPDGGRYFVDGRPYDGDVWKFECDTQPMIVPRGTGPLPAPIPPYWLTSNDVKQLETLGQMPAGMSKKIEDARAAASACTDKLWQQKYNARDRANNTANITFTTRENRRTQLLADYAAEFPKACAKPKKSFDAAVEGAMAEHRKRRMALYASVAPALAQPARSE